MNILPAKSKDYPLRILVYWLILWSSFFLYSTLKLLPSISDNGFVVEKAVCLETASSGRFDEGEECIGYDKPYSVPVGTELQNNFKTTGIYTTVVTWLLGLMLMQGKRIEEREDKKDAKITGR